MAFTDPTHVITCTGTIIWEAVKNPDPIDGKAGAFSHNLRIAVPANAPEIAELQKLVADCLASPKAAEKNIGPSNPGNNPISPIDEAKFGKHGLSGQVCFSAGTMQGCPQIFDANGVELTQPMAYGPQLYNGAKVRLLVHAYPYNNKQKGVNFGLDGVQIIDGTAPKILIGEGGMAPEKVAAAFASVSGGAAPAVPGTPPAAPAPAGDFPPAGWLAHPTAAGYFYCGTEVLTEADLRAKFAAPVPPAVPPAPHTGYMEPPAPPVADFPPAGWLPHPSAPGFYYKGQEVLSEAQLRAKP